MRSARPCVWLPRLWYPEAIQVSWTGRKVPEGAVGLMFLPYFTIAYQTIGSSAQVDAKLFQPGLAQSVGHLDVTLSRFSTTGAPFSSCNFALTSLSPALALSRYAWIMADP